MTPRFYIDPTQPLRGGAEFGLPAGAARHAQVLRLQPGASVRLFDGQGGEWSASVQRMGRSDVQVRVDVFHAVERELPVAVTLALGMPANERMDTLVEKATELGVATIQPLLCERSVLRLSGDRAAKKVAHWQAVAVAACEQSGRTRVPQVAPVLGLLDWLGGLPPRAEPGGPAARLLLSLRDARAAGDALRALALSGMPGAAGATPREFTSLSGPEGGFTDSEESAARRCGFVPITLGPRTLRADTAPLALLAHLTLLVPTESPG
jgi:16S rRNA (uracil1498-N3)-methyltransferase